MAVGIVSDIGARRADTRVRPYTKLNLRPEP